MLDGGIVEVELPSTPPVTEFVTSETEQTSSLLVKAALFLIGSLPADGSAQRLQQRRLEIPALDDVVVRRPREIDKLDGDSSRSAPAFDSPAACPQRRDEVPFLVHPVLIRHGTTFGKQHLSALEQRILRSTPLVQICWRNTLRGHDHLRLISTLSFNFPPRVNCQMVRALASSSRW